MRGELTVKLLELIADVAGSTSDHLEGFLRAGYGASIRSMERETRKAAFRRGLQKTRDDIQKRLRQRYARMVYDLKKDGLIIEKRLGDKKVLKVTERGYSKVKFLKLEFAERLPVPVYALGEDKRVLIISFDVPEKDRRKRAWLRSVLKNMGLKMVQRSVWVGRGVLPKEFLDDIDRMRLTEFVEIFQVTKTGSLASIL